MPSIKNAGGKTRLSQGSSCNHSRAQLRFEFFVFQFKFWTHVIPRFGHNFLPADGGWIYRQELLFQFSLAVEEPGDLMTGDVWLRAPPSKFSLLLSALRRWLKTFRCVGKTLGLECVTASRSAESGTEKLDLKDRNNVRTERRVLHTSQKKKKKP